MCNLIDSRTTFSMCESNTQQDSMKMIMYLLQEYKNELVTMIGSSMNKYLDQQCELTHNLNYLSYLYYFHPLHITTFKELFNRVLIGDIIRIQGTINKDITGLERTIGDDIGQLQTFITTIEGSISEFNTINSGLTSNITEIEKELQEKFREIQKEIQDSIGKINNELTSHIIKIKRKLVESQKMIIKQLDKNVKQVQGHLEKYVSGTKSLEFSTEEILKELEKVNISEIVELANKEEPDFLEDGKSDPTVTLLKKALDNIKGSKETIPTSIRNIQLNLTAIQQAITSNQTTIKQIERLSNPINNGNITEYQEFVKGVRSIEGQLTKIANELEDPIEELESKFVNLDKYIDPLIKQYSKVIGSRSFKRDITVQLLTIIRYLMSYKSTKDINMKHIILVYDYLKNFKDSVKPELTKMNTYTEIYKELGSIITNLNESKDNIDSLDHSKLESNFTSIQSKGSSLSDRNDLAKKELGNIEMFQKLLDKIKELNDKLKPLQTKIQNLQFNSISSFNSSKFKVDELDKSFQEVKKIKDTYGYSYISNLDRELSNIKPNIETLQKMEKILQHYKIIYTNKTELNNFGPYLTQLNGIVKCILCYSRPIKCYLTNIKSMEPRLSVLKNLKVNIKKVRRYMKCIGKYIKLVYDTITENEEFIKNIVGKLDEYEGHLNQINSLIEIIQSEGSGNALEIRGQVPGLSEIKNKIDQLTPKIQQLKGVKDKIKELQNTLTSITDCINKLESNIQKLELSIESIVKEVLKCCNVLLTFNVCRMTHITNHKNHINMSINAIISVVFRVKI